MVLSSKQIIGLPVRTKSGLVLGTLASFELNSDTGRIDTLHVQIPGVLPHLLHEEAMVAWAQVVFIDEKEVVVVDAFVHEGPAWIQQRFAVPPTT
jgi:sporulation protein YlmC with PRC-barrel domain